ncbi:hypothetical protein K435DRAFT_791276 [Dendrothele bispora CBS 962.96]|uniref:Uncharacterized protein n=1 Tax=Dendrothele bispora (strain CBS 962.96) TaxID=1314807 RepID=A0A4S8MP80_DENBC|nr:hypothetical protein K435DRAFT_791276 [Dendrothele bispora CBS 962.96]
MPIEMKSQYSQFGGAISEMATESLKGWRNSIGEAAITMVDQILKGKNEEERKTFIEGQFKGTHQNRLYYYPDNNAERSEVVTSFFVTYVCSFTRFNICVVLLQLNALPKAALVLAISAIDRAFLLSQNGTSPGDFSSDHWIFKDFSLMIHRLFEKKEDGKDRVTAQMWSQIIAAAKAHVEPQTSNVTSSIPWQDEEEMPDELLCKPQML